MAHASMSAGAARSHPAYYFVPNDQTDSAAMDGIAYTTRKRGTSCRTVNPPLRTPYHMLIPAPNSQSAKNTFAPKLKPVTGFIACPRKRHSPSSPKPIATILTVCMETGAYGGG